MPGLSKINTVGGQLLLAFSAIYIMIGLAVLGMFFAVVGETIEKAKARRQAEKERKEMVSAQLVAIISHIATHKHSSSNARR